MHLTQAQITQFDRADMQFDETDWRSHRGNMGVLNLFRTLFGPDYFPRNLRVVKANDTSEARGGL